MKLKPRAIRATRAVNPQMMYNISKSMKMYNVSNSMMIWGTETKVLL
jgi:hypothetical protein